MARALALAERGLYTTDPNPRVGCVLWRDGELVGEAWHVRAGEPHAEVLALRAAGAAARGATAYVTLEPCSHTGRTPPCADALIAAGIARVHCATADPNPLVAGAGIRRLQAAGIAVSVGLLADEARALNVGFFSRFERARPWVRMKLAMSLDGRTANADGVKAWISGEASRADVQHWRARSSAVLTGAGTVCADDPRLDVRLEYGPWVRQPLRIVLDSAQRCPPTAKIFATSGEAATLVFAAVAAATVDVAPVKSAGTTSTQSVEQVARTDSGLDLSAVLQRLAARQVNELLVECGARLAAGFLLAGLVDELVLYVAPKFLGADAAALTDLRGAQLVGDERQLVPPNFEFQDVRRFGDDLRLILRPKRA
jgi:diaminohydroxyphosphoribosylaminopyrimidine deaminase/5-amino-6-(5-phosphoribosylamino)uracil reductase